MTKKIALWCPEEATREEHLITGRQGWPLYQKGSSIAPDTDYLLLVDQGALFLQSVKEKDFKPFCIDYLGPDFVRRIRSSNRNDLLLKACGLKKGNTSLFDACFGLGYDAIFLSSYDFDVTGAERNPVVQELVINALSRAKETGAYGDSFVSFYAGSAQEYLDRFPETRFDVVYLDPMFSGEEERSALAKKEMRIFRDLVGDDQDAPALFRKVFGHATNRVVVKRSDSAAPIVPVEEKPISISFEGKSVRYDVYLV